jgi:protein ImuB
MKRVLCIWLPNWPLQRLLAAQPELRGQPVVLYHTTRLKTGVQGQRVLTCSHQAARCGVEPGFSVAEAEGLFTGSRSKMFLSEHNEQADLKALKQLAMWCQRFSPTVGLAEPYGCSNKRTAIQHPDSLLLDIAGCVHLFHGESSLADQVAGDFREQTLTVALAIADTIGAAWAVAHFADDRHPTGSDESDVYERIVPPGQQASYLQDLPVAALRLERETLQTLRELNVRTIGQLRRLPRATLPSRLGKQVLWRLDQALGECTEQMVPVELVPPAEIDHTCLQPISQLKTLVVVLRQLLEQLMDQLQPRQEGVQKLLVQLQGADRDSTQFSVGLVAPCDSPAYLAEMVAARLEKQRVPREVIGVQVRATATVPIVASQVGLFDEPADLVEQKQFRQLLDRMIVRLGEQTVRKACLLPDAQPEYAIQWQPLGQPLGQGSSLSAQDHDLACNPPFFSARPLWVKKRPIQISVLAELTDGPPIRFGWNGNDYVVLRSWGPERIETGWWRTGLIQRDYYRVETTNGQRFWLFRQISTGSWFLHGRF